MSLTKRPRESIYFTNCRGYINFKTKLYMKAFIDSSEHVESRCGFVNGMCDKTQWSLCPISGAK